MKNESPLSGILALVGWSITWLAVSVSCASLNSCAPKVIDVHPIAPAVVHLRATAQAATVIAKRQERDAVSIDTGLTDQSKQLVESLAAAGALRKSGLATQADLDANYQRWQQAESINRSLVTASKSLVIDAHELTAATTATTAESATVEQAAVTQDHAVVEQAKALVAATADAVAWRKARFVAWVILACGLVYLFCRFVMPALITAAKPPLT